MIEGQQPVLLALQVCDEVHIDPDTGKRTLLGLITRRKVPAFPHTITQLVVH